MSPARPLLRACGPWAPHTAHLPHSQHPGQGHSFAPSSGPWAGKRGRGEKAPWRRLGQAEPPLCPQLPPSTWFLRGLGCREEAPGPSHPPTDPPTVLRDKRPRRSPLPDTRTPNRSPVHGKLKHVPQRKFKKKQRKEAEEAGTLQPGRPVPSPEKGRCPRSRYAGPWASVAWDSSRTGSEILQRPYHVPSSPPCHFVCQPQGHHKVDMNHCCFAEEKHRKAKQLA